VALWRYIQRDKKTWWELALHMIPLTIIFDSLCIALGMFWYNPDVITGIKIGPMPIEDLLYTVVAICIMPALWKLYGRNKGGTDAH
jgi:lycopene cyclase domain-containing protein